MTPEQELVAEALPAYEILGELGRGGWGIVLEGRHKHLDRPVAIKQLPSVFGADPDVRSRFLAEARLLASLDHPHIVPVYDFVERKGLCVLVMEKLPGGTVWSRFVQHGMAAEAACGIGVVSAVALEHAHQRGILHRDVKPENLMFSAAGVLKVTDFGIAKVLSGGRTMATRTGDVLGTPPYMAPEQAMGQEVGPGTDIYSLGVMLYELLSGRLPFSADSAMAVLFKHVHETPPPLSDVAPAVAETVMRALEKDPADRYASSEEFGVALAEAATSSFGAGWLRRREMTLMAGGRVLAAVERGDVAPASTRPSSRVTPESSRPDDGPTLVPSELVPVTEVEDDLPEVRAHELRELKLLQQQRSGASPFRIDDWDEVERLLGAHGTAPTERLGLPGDAPASAIRDAAVALHERWQRRAESPLASRESAEAARVLVRTCEGLLHQLADSP